MTFPKSLRSLDGPLLDQQARRADVKARMARDLRLLDAAGSEREAVMTLIYLGYGALDVAILAEDARRDCLGIATVH